MNTKRITSKAKLLHRTLIVGVASLSLLGVLSGCTIPSSKVSNAGLNLNAVLPNHKIRSSSLDRLLTRQFKCPVNSVESDTVFHNGKLGTRDSDSSSIPASDHLSDYRMKRKSGGVEQEIRYRLSNKHKTLTLSSNHARNTLSSITYRLVSVPSNYGGSYHFKPIRLKRFGHRHYAKIPNSVAMSNMLNISPSSHVKNDSLHSLNSVQKN